MNLHEYQAKQLFARYGLPAPVGYACTTPREAEEAASKIGSGPWVVKCQVHAGGRGKAGGVKVVKSKEEIRAFAEHWLGKRLVTYQTDANGQPVNQILVEAATDIDKELYLGAVVDRSSRRVVFMASTEGGVEIEKVAEETPHLIHKIAIDPLAGPMPYQGRELAFKLGLEGKQVQQFTKIFMGLATIFLERDLALIEINPLVITTQGDLICLDGKLGADGNEWCRNKDVVVNRQQLAIFNKAGNSTDSALAAVFAPPNVDEFSSTAASTLLGQIIQPWFYNQLRTEEQLGYAVFAFPMNVGRQWGMGFLLQSSDKQPAFLWQRFQAFFPTAEAKLRAMKPEEFAQLQQAVISQMLQAPQTLGDEASKLSKDFDRGNMRFDSRDKVVAQIKLLTPQKLADFFHQTVVDPQGMTILSQISGSQNGKADYAQPKGGKVWENVSALQQSLPLMRENE